ncbi:hypothetical protein ISN45_Aa04g032590 [Arabidopsis thaliana x Arabidopsis arenosa]|uniref:Uncharacterized protein n=1 Tax=Arabidopsis thaliana x Arabidopsis arenosa TaxID=1240361 RepID=A0A8T2AAS9_9BRAS|nr:hypothetical protein ISN45_Aa04g032590 [Arabidopsis thaliana x Arabidopsis arenosa]
MACLRSFSRRSLYPKLFSYMTSRPVVLHHHIKDFTESTFPESNLLIRSFHRQVFFEDRRKMSFVQPVGFSGVLLCRHMSSKPEELCSKIDAFGNVVEDLVSEKSVEAIDECTAAIENFSFPGDFVQYVINGIHELTGFNWSMSIVLTAFLVSVLMSPVSMRVQKQALELQAMYFYMITSRIYVSTLYLMLKSNQIVKLRSILGWPDIHVNMVSEQQRIMARLISLMREFIDVVKKKDRK